MCRGGDAAVICRLQAVNPAAEKLRNENKERNRGMMSETKKRWDFIDLLEFIGMFTVLIYHSTTYSCDFISENTTIYYVRYYLRTILSTCVPLFFFANGFLLFNRKIDLKKHLVKTVTLFILTVVWGLIIILFLMPIEHEYLSIKEIVGYLCHWHAGWISYLWYMGTLVCIYILFPILKSAFDTQKKVFVYFIIACAIFTFGNTALGIIGTILASGISGHEINLYGMNLFSMFNPLQGIHGYSFVYFCLGGFAYDYVGKINSWNRKRRNIIATSVIIVSCAGLFITGVLLSKFTGAVWDVVWNGYDTFFTLLNVCAIFVLTVSYSSGNRLVDKYIFNVSVNTLGIYFIHEILIHLTKPFVEQWIVAQNFIGCMIYAFFIMTISLLLAIIIKKIPIFNCLVDLKKATNKFLID